MGAFSSSSNIDVAIGRFSSRNRYAMSKGKQKVNRSTAMFSLKFIKDFPSEVLLIIPFRCAEQEENNKGERPLLHNKMPFFYLET